MNVRLLITLLAAAFLVALAAVPSGAAEPIVRPLAIEPPPNTQCSGTLPPGTYHDVTIPEHQTCAFSSGVHVTHNVTGMADSTLNAGDGGVIVDNDVVIQNARNLQFGGAPNRVGHDFDVNGLSIGVNNLCNTFIGHDLEVQQLTSAALIAIGDPCVFADEVGHDVVLNNNAGFVDARFTGGGNPPAGFTPCMDAFGPAFVGHDLQASGNTGALDIFFTNSCHDLKVSNNSGFNFVVGNRAGHDANCSNNSPFIAFNLAGHENNGCA